MTDAEAHAGTRHREEYRERCAKAIEGLDLVLTPTLPCVAPRVGQGEIGDLQVRERVVSRTFPVNILGWPALALPCGPAEAGLPASVQLVGRPGRFAALERFLQYVSKKPKVWITRRIDIARHWLKHHPHA